MESRKNLQAELQFFLEFSAQILYAIKSTISSDWTKQG